MTNESEQRARLLRDTFFARQQNTVDDAGGRYAKLTPSKLTGQTSAVPQQPPNSPWSKSVDELTGSEPPLGFDVNAQEATGTPKEIQSSLGESLAAPTAMLPDPPNLEEPTPNPTTTADFSNAVPLVDRVGSSAFSKKWRRR
jgi:hypothetical protein